LNRIVIRYILALALILTTIAGTAFVFWAHNSFDPSSEAITALRSDGQVKVTEEAGLVIFESTGGSSSTGFIFYPGDRIDYRSYAPLLRQIAARRYLVILTPMPLNLAIFHINAAEQALAMYPEIKHWVIGGHSVGGVAAARYTANHPAIEGIVFLASYPADNALKDKDIKVLSIYGSQDSLATDKEIESSRTLLPADTIFVKIEGGNHSQFGSYGFQPDDGQATISPEQQWMQVVDATAKLLDIISNKQ